MLDVLFPPNSGQRDVVTLAVNEHLHAVYAAPERFCPLIGRLRRRFPVAAKIALVDRGWNHGRAGLADAAPFLAAGEREMQTSVFGASLSRTTG